MIKVIPIVTTHYCDYFGVFWVVRFVEISGKKTKNNKIFLRNFAKICNAYIQTSRNFKLVGFANNSGRIIF